MLSAALALAVGCASDEIGAAAYRGTPEADGGGPPAASTQVVAPLAEGSFRDLDFDARKQFMREAVMPTMRPLFVELDPERFESFSCATCHGSGAAAGTFSMPSAELPVLGGMAVSDPDLTAFMRNTVKPKMAELLGEPELRCGACHPSAS